ncbi:MAG TPA: hypothetical protein VF092_14165 [Longimicrobium sp.]
MAVPAILHAEHNVVRALRRAGAVTPASARPLLDLRPLDRRALVRLVSAGCVGEAAPGRYWLDEERYGAHRGRRRVRALAMMAAVLAIFVALLLLGVIRT